MKRKTLIRNLVVIAGVLLLVWAFTMLGSGGNREYKPVATSLAVAQLKADNVSDVQIDDKEQTLRITLKKSVDGTDGATKIYTKYPAGTVRDVLADVQDSKASYTTNVTSDGIWQSILIMLLPVVLIVVVFFFLMNRLQGGGRGGVMGFGKSKAKQLTKDMPKTTFADVAGADEAVEELYEIKDFLQNPARYQALGAKIPKGVLLYGPPGTGKTLLARAVAGEAGVPFFTISGSDFVEMFVGVGASRVRDLFEQAKENSPCIIFVDEIDAVGRQRGAGLGGGHDEREQTLNQLLVEMDGFGDRQGIILIAATNRPDILDPALLRPGRFDRQIPVSNPDMAGRRQILAVHSKGKPLAEDADLDGLAKRTPGMSGADLANVVNEAALLTARENGHVITAATLEEAVDRVVGGPRRKSRIISEHEKKVTAYHEGGHTLAAWASRDLDPVYKVTILARGRTGGHALAVPENDKGMYTRNEMIARLVFAMGGRAAEELVFAEPTTGASSDIDQATKIARAMVTEYGMSARLGAVKYGQDEGDPFLGRGVGGGVQYSQDVAKDIDEEVRSLIEAAHTEAWAILNEYRDVLDALAGELLEKETLVRKDLERIFAPVEKRPRLTQFDVFGDRIPSDKPPIKTPKELALEKGEPWPPEGADDDRALAAANGQLTYGQPNGSHVSGQNGQPAYPQPTSGGTGPYQGGDYQGQYPTGQVPSGQYSGGQYSGGQYTGERYGGGQQQSGQESGEHGRQGYQYPGPQYPSGQHPTGQYPSGQYPAGPTYGDPSHGNGPAYGQPHGSGPSYSGGAAPSGSRPDYGAPAGWSAPGWPPADEPEDGRPGEDRADGEGRA
ncbi:ATP-dependent zinc metalloprotease FtsH [Tsukamurella sp. 8F]|uniref:ATP-dependent zinc metalloprotease FtsH n=1 Tax=unclassified Tsukamurella TaxID=2633480 RepID=UPI0023B9C2D9|nr:MULTISPECIES: ATP-dependent zinc metalloprotease FtsH [unclassified Tsukamurella]MDF0530920.1 ATP-dependent zinc metalloprotease FtsH [Tsukamurella sp. 8J]MDF0588245.1 ATP-dependent zinc metalloprotease FtsH [Tsukamurella sp. 8F]